MTLMARIFSLRNESGDARPTELTERVGERLLRARCISRDQLQIGLHEQRRCGDRLGDVLVRLGFLTEDMLAAVLAERAGCTAVDLTQIPIDPALIHKMPREFAQQHRVVPIGLQGSVLEIAMADPYDVVAMDALRSYFPRVTEIVPYVASAAAIAEVIDGYADVTAMMDAVLEEMETGRHNVDKHEVWDHPIVRLVDMILRDAAGRGASDIHLEPEQHFVRVRYRIDGLLHPIRILHNAHWPELSHRVKIMAGLNIAETRRLQDGRFALAVGGAMLDFRVAVMPTAHGENIVIRILDHRRALVPMPRLGFRDEMLDQMDSVLQRPEGIVLVTGPTGSGKTTTLYAMLAKIRSVDVNIMTLEEPIEYHMDLIRQTAVREGHGLGFADGVRGILRQDPDVIFVGEVRDVDTARMALRASMTGHQVFSTLHCNNALGAIPRLHDLGITPRMMEGHIAGILAQRLARKLCPHCKTMRPANDEEMRWLNCVVDSPDGTEGEDRSGFAEHQSPYLASVPMVGVAVGCDSCGGSGYRGRVAVAEMIRVTPELDALIAEDAPRARLYRQMRRDGFRSMLEDGLGKILDGEITFESLRRVLDLRRSG